MDFDRLIDTIILIFIELMYDMIHTVEMFMFSPRALAESQRDTGVVSPITLLVVSLILFGFLNAILKIMAKKVHPKLELQNHKGQWIDYALYDYDKKNIIREVLPTFLLLFVHSVCVKISFGLFDHEISYRSVVYSGAYTLSFVVLSVMIAGVKLLVFMPRLVRTKAVWRNGKWYTKTRLYWLQKWFYIFVCPYLAFVLYMALSSYFKLLAAYSSTSVKTALGMWLLGTAMLFLAYVIVWKWYEPISIGTKYDGTEIEQ